MTIKTIQADERMGKFERCLGSSRRTFARAGVRGTIAHHKALGSSNFGKVCAREGELLGRPARGERLCIRLAERPVSCAE